MSIENRTNRIKRRSYKPRLLMRFSMYCIGEVRFSMVSWRIMNRHSKYTLRKNVRILPTKFAILEQVDIEINSNIDGIKRRVSMQI